MSLWPLPSQKSSLFIAGRTLAEWEVLLGRTFNLRYPWEVLDLNAELLATIHDWPGHPEVTTIGDAKLQVGAGTTILPGVVIEGTVIIGRDCRIGPNCYLRGTTAIGDGCHVGHAVEVKSSILSPGTAVAHLSYVGDSYLGPRVNLGAGTMTSNFRHDGGLHRSDIEGVLIDTGRDKLGAIIGEGVHTGINTSIYPGRKLGPKTTTLPGEVISQDRR